MATGGTGDVLAGMLGAWLAQLLDAEAACKIAVYLHGSAGELADADNGEVSMTAGDLVDHIGDAILEVTARRRVATTKSRVSDATDRVRVRSSDTRSIASALARDLAMGIRAVVVRRSRRGQDRVRAGTGGRARHRRRTR